MRLSSESGYHVPLEPHVEHVVQVDVAQYRRQHRSLRRAPTRLEVLLTVEDTHVQTLADEPEKRPIDDPLPEHLQEHRAINAVEVGLYVKLQDPHSLPPTQHLVKGTKRVVRAAFPEAVREVAEERLVQGVENLAQSFLHNLVLD